jgi:aspartate/methionine/tyrosine aminotransferase
MLHTIQHIIEPMNTSEIPFKIRTNVKKLSFSPTLAINEQVRNAREDGVQILHMGFGQSPFPVHPEIQSALGANADKNLYLPSAGHPELREMARNYFADKFGFDNDKFIAVIGPGSKQLIFDIQLAVEGDLLLPVPSWVSYEPQSRMTQDQIIRIPTTLEYSYHITADSLGAAILKAKREGLNPKKLIINYPNNPSGLTLPLGRLESIAQVCRKYNILVISDEIYGLVNFHGNHVSIARYYPEGTIITSGLSKHISLGGYRLGIALIPKALKPVFEALTRIASETWSCVSAPVQYAACKTLENDPVIEEYIQTCTRIHQMVTGYVRHALVRLGIQYPALQGAFYLYPDFVIFRERLLKRGIKTSQQLAMDLLETMQLATLPGTAFGDDPKNLRLRLATCDYDGQAALDFYRENPDPTDVSFIQTCCPNIVLACDRIAAYFEN